MSGGPRAVAGLALATAAARAAGVLGSVFVARALGPASLGAWSTFRGAVSYGNINHLGVLEAYRASYPREVARGELDRARQLEQAALSAARASSVAFAAAASLVLLLTARLAPDSMVGREPLAALLLAWTCVPVTLGTFWTEALGVRAAYARQARLRALRGVAYAVLIPCGAWLDGVRGAVAGLLASEVLLTGLTRASALQVGATRSGRWCANTAKELVGLGLPISMGWWCVLLLESVDRVVCAAWLGADATGLYAVGAMLASLLMLAPEALSRVLSRTWNLHRGAGDVAKLAAAIDDAARHTSIALALLAAGCALLAPLAIEFALPEYSDAGPSATILVAGAAWLALAPLSIERLVSTGRSRRLLVVGPIALALHAALCALGASFGSLEALAWSSVLAHALFVALLWMDRAGRRQITALLAPGAVGLALVVGAQRAQLEPTTAGCALLALAGAAALHAVRTTIRAAGSQPASAS